MKNFIFLTLGLAIGGCAGFFVAKHHYEKQFNEALNELHEPKKKESTVVEATETKENSDGTTDIPESSSAVSDHEQYTKTATDYGSFYKDSMGIHKKPTIEGSIGQITADQYYHNEPGFDQSTITYDQYNETLTDDDTGEELDIDDTIGEFNLMDMLKDEEEDIFFIRNCIRKEDYQIEVIRTE